MIDNKVYNNNNNNNKSYNLEFIWKMYQHQREIKRVRSIECLPLITYSRAFAYVELLFIYIYFNSFP